MSAAWETIWIAYREPFPGTGHVPELLIAFGDREQALAWANVEHDALGMPEGTHWEYGVTSISGRGLTDFCANHTGAST